MSDQTHSQNKVVKISKSALPLFCPTAEVALWSAHPKVYLPIEKTGEAVCPYCGTVFQLED